MPDLVDGLALLLVVLDFAASLGFCVAYHITAKWWAHPFGVSIMTYQLIMTVVMGLTAWRWITWTNESPSLYFEILRTLVFAAIPPALIWRTVILLRIQRKEGRHEYGD